MPLMVDPSGYPVFAGGPSVSYFDYTPTATSGEAARTSVFNPLGDAQQTAESALTATAQAVQATANATALAEEIIKDQQAIQAGLDSETPRNIMLAGLAFVLLVFLLGHPRFLARVLASAHKPKKEVKKALSFESPPNSATPLQDKPKLPIGGGDLREGWMLRDDSTTDALAENIFLKEKENPFLSPMDGYTDTASTASPPTVTPPPHITPMLQHLPYSSSLLYAPFNKLPGSWKSAVTLSELYIIVAYLVLVSFALVWRSDITPTTETKGYGYDFYRTGLVSMAHIPWAVALGLRGNLVGLCVAKGYDKLKRLHKIVGRVCFTAGSLHTFCYFHKFAVAGNTAKMMSKSFILAGTIAWVGLAVIAVTSIPQVRDRCYGFFKACHIVGMVGLLVGMCFHVKVAVPWCIASLAIYAVSIACSITKTRLAHAEFTVLPGSETTLISIPALRTGWRPGQHVRVRVPGLGLRYGFEGHPFTIASAPNGEGMALMCKVAGDWTRELYNFAGTSPTWPGEKQSTQTVTATIVLEGPYGGMGNTMLPSFSGVVLAAGGSGISHSLALAHDVVLRAHTGAIRARTVDLVWAVPTQESAKPLMPTLLELVADAQALEEKCLEGRKHRQNLPPPVALRVHIYVTRCPVSSPILLLEPEEEPIDNPFASELDDVAALPHRGNLRRQPSAAESKKKAYLSRNRSLTLSFGSKVSSGARSYYAAMSGIEVLPKRPDFDATIGDVLDEVIDRARRERNDPSGVCVATCGPGGFVAAVRDATRRIEGKKRRMAGGVDYEEEHFGF